MRVLCYTTLLGFLSLSSYATSQNLKNRIKTIEYEVFSVQGLNSEFADFSPVRYKSQIVFASDRIFDYNNIGEDNWTNTKRINLFTANVKEEANDSLVFSKVKIFDNHFVGDDHSGPITFDRDASFAVFSKVTHEKEKFFGTHTARPQLYGAEFKEGKWTIADKLPFVKATSTYGHPSLTPDGKTLYYVSDEFGGRGGKDLFVVKMKNGSWGEPKALNVLNSKGDELFPTIVGNKLYFASNGLEGEGGLDLFVSEFIDGDWTTPENLGNTINTAFDEFGIVFNPDKSTGFFTSNRDSGKGEDDIYYFNQIEKLQVESDEIAGQFTYRFLEGKNPKDLEVLLIDEDGQIADRAMTNPDGTFKFSKLDPNKKYMIKLTEDGEEVELTLFGQDADAFLLANEEGEFVFKKLSPSKRGTLSLVSADDVDLDGTGELNGQFAYANLEGKSLEGLEVYLVDEDGNIVHRTKSDENGVFKFEKLDMSKNYTIKSDDLEDNIEMYIYNKEDYITAVLAANTDGEFVYRKLEGSHQGLTLLSAEEEELVFREKTIFLSGEFKYRNSQEPMGVVEYEIRDLEDNVLMVNKTNADSYFKHTTLKDADKLIFKIDGDRFKEDVDLIIVDKNKQFVVQLDKDTKGYFVYEKLKGTSSSLSVSEEEMVSLLKKDGLTGIFEYQELSGDSKGLEYEIYDDNNDMVKRGVTDEYGFFAHPELSKEGNYQFKTLNGNAAKLSVLSGDDEDVLVIRRSENDLFKYEMLNGSVVDINVNSNGEDSMIYKFNKGELIDQLFYPNDVYVLDENHKKQLDEVIARVKLSKKMDVAILSHASNKGSDKYNQRISEKRMKATVDYLINNGVSSSRIHGQYFGESEPIVKCSGECSEEEQAKNRRTEIKLIQH